MAGTDLGMQIVANVRAFYYGTSPNKFFDYIAAGLPVLTNYPGWIAGLIQEYGCGVTVPPGDPARFAAALEQMADRRDELVNMGKRSYALAQKEFDRTRLADRLVDVLERAAGSPSG